MKWTQDQKSIIDSRQCNLLVSAAAGSGKTAVLVERIIQMISDKDNPMDIDELLVVTFTKAAAAQMRDKIARALEQMLELEPSNEHYIRQLNYINKANILTIDSFCYQVVKEHFHVIGIEPCVRVGEAGELGLLREEILEEVIENFYENNPDFVRFSDAFSSDKNDAKIEEYILKVYSICSSYPRPSEWIRQAKESLHVETEEEFAALTFVQQYLEEIRSLAQGIKDKIRKALDQVRDVDGPIYMEKALLSDLMMVEDIIAAKNYTQLESVAQCKFANIGRGKKGEFDEEIAERIKKSRDIYKKEISTLLDSFRLPFTLVLKQFQNQERILNALLDITEAFRNRFLEAKLARGILEFSDIEHFALQLLCEKYDENGEPIPSDIGKEMAEEFREILIDEYQDSNFLQEAILKCVSTLYRGKYNIFMVGDVKQSIYSFRMARPDLFMDKYHSYSTKSGAKCRKLLLKNNFRSRGNVLETINYIFYQIMGEDLGGIEYTEEEALIPGKTFPEVLDDSVELLLGESKDFEFLNRSDEEMTAEKEETLDENLEDIGKKELEATIVAKRILSMLGRDGRKPYQIVDYDVDEKTGKEIEVLRDVRLSDMVILFRAPSSFQQIFAEVLMGYGISVKVQNEIGYFDTTEIQLVLSLLKVIDNPHNDVEVAAVLRSYFAGFNSNELALLALVKRYVDVYNNANCETEKKENSRKQSALPIYQIIKLLADYARNVTTDIPVEHEKRIERMDEVEKTGIQSEIIGEILDNPLAAYRDEIVENICKKCDLFVEFIEGLQAKKTYITISHLISDIYYDTGYYFYVEVMPEGSQRIRNLDLFYEECRSFEHAGTKTLFEFLLFVEKLQKKSISLGGDPAPESTDDVVRIMSIHKSKGLEFPVAFLSGIGKNFNLMDTKTPLIIHSDYYIGAKYIDTDKRCGNDTFARKAFASLMVTESIAEELRILYVALTRAKEKLIMTGVTPDITALVKKYEALAEHEEQKLSYAVVHTAKNYLDMIVMAFMRNATFHEAMKHVRKRMDAKTGNILSAEYEGRVVIQKPDIRLRVFLYNFYDLAVQHVQSGMEKQMNRGDKLEELSRAPMQTRQQIEERLTWEYANASFTMQKSKLTVTEIKRMYEVDYEPSDVIERPRIHREEYVVPQPRFVSGIQPMDAAAKGTWVHKLMEMFPNAEVTTKEQVEKTLEDMWKTGRLPEETRSFITTDKVYAFVVSKLGKRMHEAAKQGNLFKEKQFVVGVPAERLLRSDLKIQNGVNGDFTEDNTPIVVQGIIDAYFREGDKIILLDYKTDKIKEGQEQVLVKRYTTQLQYYKETLQQLTGLSVAESYIYSFALGKEIQMNSDAERVAKLYE